MKKVLFGTLLVALVGFGIYSCTKQQTQQSTSEQAGKTFGDLKLRSGFNKSVLNVYGIEHNAWMDDIASASGFSTLYNEDLFDEAETYTSAILPNPSTTWADYQVVEAYALGLLNLAPSIAKSTIIADSLFDDEMSEGLGLLFNITNTTNTLEDFLEEVSDLEEFILDEYNPDYDSTTYEGNAAAFLLAACSIAKNSGEYWNDAENKSAHPWHGRVSALPAPNPSSPSLQSRLPRWLRAAARDIATFVSSEECVIYPNENPAGIYLYDFACAWRAAGRSSSQVE